MTLSDTRGAPLEEAAAWWAKFQECEPAAEDVAAWLAWMDDDKANAEAFESVNGLALRIRRTRTTAPFALAGLTGNHIRRRISAKQYAMAACILAAVGVLGVLALMRVPRSDVEVAGGASYHYVTQTGGQREVLLTDGSRVILGGASSIVADFSPKRRTVRLVNGEAYFEVRHEASGRPFEVDAGIATVRALGTAFNIRKDDSRVAVTVTEGRVKVARQESAFSELAEAAGIEHPEAAEVGRAEQIIIEPRNTRLAVTEADPVRATSWREGRLEFIDEPLDVVIRSVSRYSVHPLMADDVGLHSITYTGTFVPNNLDSWLGALQTVFPVEVSREGAVTTIRARPRVK